MDIEKDKHLNYFPALTGVRIVAAYLVYLHHTNPFSIDRFGSFLNHLVIEFHIGVSIFFVLSGFLITFRYFELSNDKKKWFKKYVQNRIARVYPMYFILTSITLFLFLFQNKQGDQPVGIYLLNITFLRGFFDDLKFTLVGQGWTLTVEECFYFTAPLIFIVIRMNKWTIFLLASGIIIIGCLLVKISVGIDFYGFFKSYQFMFIYTFFGRCFEFFCGIGLALFLKNQLIKERAGYAYTYCGLLLMALLILFLSLLGKHGESGITTVFGIVINNFLLPISIAFFFYGLIRESSIVKKLLSSPLLVMLGKASYTFYLIHAGVFYLFINQHVTQNYVLVFLSLNFIAIILWRFVEEPLNKAIRNL